MHHTFWQRTSQARFHILRRIHRLKFIPLALFRSPFFPFSLPKRTLFLLGLLGALLAVFLRVSSFFRYFSTQGTLYQLLVNYHFCFPSSGLRR